MSLIAVLAGTKHHSVCRLGDLPLAFWLFFLGLLGLMFAAVIVALLLSRKRRGAMEKAAAAMGLMFYKDSAAMEAVEGQALKVDALPPFHLDPNPKGALSNILRGNIGGREGYLFDFLQRQVVSVGRVSEKPRRETAALFRISFPGLLAFSFRHREPNEERVLSLLGGLAETAIKAVGTSSALLRGLSFDAVPEFAERCYLWGPDEASVRSFFEPDRLRALLAIPAGLSVAAGGGLLMIYRLNRLVPPEELDAFAREAATIADRLTHA
jgi:hypothetical protein